MPGLFNQTGGPDPDLFNPPPKWGVGAAQGMPLMHRYDTGGPERWLAEQKAKQSFEDFLGQSGMSDEEKAQARISYFNPRLGDIIARSRQARENEQDRLYQMKMQEQARQDALKAREDAKTQHEKDVAEAKKADIEAKVAGLTDASPTGAVPRWTAPTAPMSPETAAFPQTVAGLIGGMTGYTPPAGQVGQSPGVQGVMARQGGSIVSRLGAGTKEWIEKNAPDSTLAKSMMAEGEFMQIKQKQAAEAETVRKAQEAKQQKIQQALDKHKAKYLDEYEKLKQVVSSPSEAMQAVSAVMSGMRPGTVKGIIERQKKEAAAAKAEADKQDAKKETWWSKALDLTNRATMLEAKNSKTKKVSTVENDTVKTTEVPALSPAEIEANKKAAANLREQADRLKKKAEGAGKPEVSKSNQDRIDELVKLNDEQGLTDEEEAELRKLAGK